MARASHVRASGGGVSRRGAHPAAVQVVADRGGSWVAVSGELDIATAERLRAAVGDALCGPEVGRLTLDLSGVRFIDAGGVHVLLDAATACSRQGIALRILASSVVRRVCALADAAEQLPID